MHYKNIILHLSLLDGIGPSALHKIIKQIGIENIADLYRFTELDLVRMGLSQAKANALVIGLRDQLLLQKELVLIEQEKAQFITMWCDEYPERLKHIDVPPLGLYVQGDVGLLSHEKMLACVGSRLAHSYTQDCLNKIVVPMIQDGWVIVSGGAAGADTYAHKIALEHSGKTVVVVGSGLCHQYPEKNKPLFKEIVESGSAIVSSFCMAMRPDVHTFPIRNRVISGLSVGCLVLQAASKSGALITAQCALDQGREVFAIPGPIYDPLSAGCHELIKIGAKLVTSVQDILDELLPELQPAAVQENFITAAGKVAKSNKAEPQLTDTLDVADRLILQHTLSPITLDDLIAKLSIDPMLLHEKLFTLSLDGKIEQDCMGLWKRI